MTTKFAVVVLLLLLTPLSLSAQGDLAPPGAPAPTMKTLEQVEPRRPISTLPFSITQPGSYYVTTNLTGNPGGVSVEASGVTLDLMGFELVGGTGHGIEVNGAHSNIVIRNGTVRDWTQSGVRADTGQNVVLEHLLASANGSHGLFVGSGAVIWRCVASRNQPGTGIFATGPDTTVAGCLAVSNSLNGIFAEVVLDSEAAFNNGHGIVAAQIADCRALKNQGDGLRANAPGGLITDSTAHANGGVGIQVSSSQTNCLVRGCVATANDTGGISLSSPSSVVDSLASGNVGYGIRVTHDCTVRDNICTGNGSPAGIEVAGSGNRIDGNALNNNDRGVRVLLAGNLIIRNSASDNGGGSTASNYVFVAGQTFGPTNNLVGADGTITNAHPWANFSF